MWRAALKHNYRTLLIIRHLKNKRILLWEQQSRKHFPLHLSVREKAGLIPELPLFGRLRLEEAETVKKPPEPGRR